MSAIDIHITSIFQARYMKSLSLLVASTLIGILAPKFAFAASFTFYGSESASGPRIRMSGAIESGDSQRLLQALKTAGHLGYRLSLDSPGGSVSEAFQLADNLVKSDSADFEYYYLRSLAMIKKGDDSNSSRCIKLVSGYQFQVPVNNVSDP